MRIDFVSPPFRGHLHPILGLACALREVAGVRVLTTSAMLDEVWAAGVDGVGLMAGREGEIEAIVNPPYPVRSDPLRLWRQFSRTLRLLEDLTAEVESAWMRERPELVIVDSVLPSAGYAAMRVGAAWWTSLASPCTMEPRRGTPAYLGGWRFRDGGFGRWRDRVGLALVRTFKRSVFLARRRRIQQLGVPRIYRTNGDEAVYSADCVLGLGMDELEFPRLWPDAFRMIGPVLCTPSRADAEDPVLDAGRRHVLVTLGTHLPWAKDEIAERFRHAAHGQERWVVHFSDGRPAARCDAAPGASFRRYGYINYERWLSSFDLVVHHGGAGVMYHCIRAGRPALVCPMDYDQFDHAARIERAGIGRWLRPRDDARAAIDSALDDMALSAACTQLQSKFFNYDPGATLRALVAQFTSARSALPCAPTRR